MSESTQPATPTKRGHFLAAKRIARTINHARTRKGKASRVRAWTAHVKALLGVK